MNLLRSLLFLLAFSHVYAECFRADWDEWSHILEVVDGRYTLTSYGLGGDKQTYAGRAESVGGGLKFRESRVEGRQSHMHDTLFLRRVEAGIVYLVPEKNLSDFEAALKEKDEFMRSMQLLTYFRSISEGTEERSTFILQVRHSPKDCRPNQSMEPTATAVTPRADARAAPAVAVAEH